MAFRLHGSLTLKLHKEGIVANPYAFNTWGTDRADHQLSIILVYIGGSKPHGALSDSVKITGTVNNNNKTGKKKNHVFTRFEILVILTLQKMGSFIPSRWIIDRQDIQIND